MVADGVLRCTRLAAHLPAFAQELAIRQFPMTAPHSNGQGGWLRRPALAVDRCSTATRCCGARS